MRDKHGRFLPGHDRDRHTLTKEERRRGYEIAQRRLMATMGELEGQQWLLLKVKGWYRQKRS